MVDPGNGRFFELFNETAESYSACNLETSIIRVNRMIISTLNFTMSLFAVYIRAALPIVHPLLRVDKKNMMFT